MKGLRGVIRMLLVIPVILDAVRGIVDGVKRAQYEASCDMHESRNATTGKKRIGNNLLFDDEKDVGRQGGD